MNNEKGTEGRVHPRGGWVAKIRILQWARCIQLKNTKISQKDANIDIQLENWAKLGTCGKGVKEKSK